MGFIDQNFLYWRRFEGTREIPKPKGWLVFCNHAVKEVLLYDVEDMGRKKKLNWPEWWEWNLEITPLLEKRRYQRDFTEIDVREMLQGAQNYRPGI